MQIAALYERYSVPRHIQQHMQVVSSVAAALYARLPAAYQEQVDRSLLMLVCLTHDLGKFLTLDLSYQPGLREPEGLDYWQDKQCELQQTYGTDEYLAVQGMLRAAGLDQATLHAIHTQISSKLSVLLDTGELLSYLYIYADMCVNWTLLTPPQDRIQSTIERIPSTAHAEKVAVQQYLLTCALRAESHLQEIYQQSPFEIAQAGWEELYERMEYERL